MIKRYVSSIDLRSGSGFTRLKVGVFDDPQSKMGRSPSSDNVAQILSGKRWFRDNPLIVVRGNET